MTDHADSAREGFSRRNVLKFAMVGTGAAVAATFASPGIAGAKVPKKVVNYQATPRGKAKCSTCASFEPPSACKLVDGAVAPDGWCSIYAPKA